MRRRTGDATGASAGVAAPVGAGSTASALLPRGRVLGLFAGMVGATIAVAVSLLAGAGELAPSSAGLLDSGPLVRFGLPVARSIHDLAASLTIGLLVLAVWAVAPEAGTSRTVLSGARLAMVRAASVSAGAWLVSAISVFVFTVADIAGVAVSSSGFTDVLSMFATRVDLGRALWVSVLMVTVVAVVTVMSARVVTAAFAAALGLAALLPLALTGHAAGSTDHQNSVSSLALHLLGVSVWVGGLGALLLSARLLGPQLPAVVRRYSALAGLCFTVVAVSGLVNAALRLGSLTTWTSVYALLLVGKVVALGLLGLAGWRHRTALLPRLETAGVRRAFLRLAGVELVIMGATMGLAVALSRSAPPSEHLAGHGGAELLGFTAPPAMTAASYFTQSYPDLLWLSIAGAGLLWYLWAAIGSARRGVAWPAGRMACWVAGCLTLVLLTSGGPAVYGRVNFSAHMLQHMGLMIVVPMLLVLGAPITLALRTLTARPDGSIGVRETLLWVLESRFLRVLVDPIVAASLFTGSLIAFYYYTGAFQASMFTHTGHVITSLYILATGYLFAWVMVGADPGWHRPPYAVRLQVMVLAALLQAVFGITLMASGTVLASQWWSALGQVDQAVLLHDQRLGGMIAVAAGFLPLLVLGLTYVAARVHRPTTTSRDPKSTGADLAPRSLQKVDTLAGPPVNP